MIMGGIWRYDKCENAQNIPRFFHKINMVIKPDFIARELSDGSTSLFQPLIWAEGQFGTCSLFSRASVLGNFWEAQCDTMNATIGFINILWARR